MKKLFAVLAVAGLFVATSCKKDYECCYTDPLEGGEICNPHNDLDKDQASAQEASCKTLGGTWTTK